MFKKLALISATAMTVCCSALAADLPRRAAPPMLAPLPVFTWTGAYFGVNAGYTASDRANVRTLGISPFNVGNVAIGARPGAVRLDREGFIGGGQVGYNYQFGMFVAGLEADIAYTDLNRTRTVIGTTGAPSTFRHSLDFLGTVRGRVGVAFDRVLVYGTGGFAYGDTEQRASFLAAGTGALAYAGRRSTLETGYTVGGGIEYALPTDSFLNFFRSSAVTIKGEYLYYNLGRSNVVVGTTGGAGLGYVSRFETNGHIGRVGINYKFGTY